MKNNERRKKFFDSYIDCKPGILVDAYLQAGYECKTRKTAYACASRLAKQMGGWKELSRRFDEKMIERLMNR